MSDFIEPWLEDEPLTGQAKVGPLPDSHPPGCSSVCESTDGRLQWRRD
jgi:hypothetical protein